MRRRNVPCSPCSGGSSSGCCSLKEKLRILWDRTIGSITRINGISPDGDGDFTIEAGSNIAITEQGTGNGLRIDTTGGVSYYTSDDPKIIVDNSDLKISTDGVASQTDLDTVAGAVITNTEAIDHIVDGTTQVGRANVAVSAQDASHATSADNATSAGTADALNVAGMDTSPTIGSNKAVTSNGILTALNGKEDKITPVKTTISLTSYGFTYGNLRKYKISDKVYLLSVYDAFHNTAGTYTVDTSITSPDVITTPLYNANTQSISGSLSIDSSGVKITLWNNRSWAYGSVLVVTN